MKSLKAIWAAVAPARSTTMQLREKQRAYFHVTDPVAAQKISRWLDRRHDAENAVHAYLRSVAGVLGAEVPFYKLDDDGYVESINFRYAMPFTHAGWKGKNNTNWLVPEDTDVIREVRSLPPFPSFREVNALLGWPEPLLDKSFRDMHLPGYQDFAQRAVRQVRVSKDNEEIFVSVPFPDTFADYPELADAIQNWRPPQGFEQIDAAIGTKIERAASFSRSPLGQSLAKARQFFQR